MGLAGAGTNIVIAARSLEKTAQGLEDGDQSDCALTKFNNAGRGRA